MTTRIVAFPPVGVLGWSPMVSRPVERSRGLFSGTRVASAAHPARRMLTLDVSALSRDRAGAGFIDQLMREIDGGVHLVRVSSQPVNWWMDCGRLRALGFTAPLTWTDGGAPMTWTDGGAPLSWFTGPTRVASTGTSADGYPTISVPGLPAGQIVARPGDVVRVYPADDRVIGQTAQVVTLARVGPGGVAVIKLASALPAGVVSLSDADTAVYEVTNSPQGAQPGSGNWSLRLDLAEVLASEIPAGAVEWNPW